MVAAANIPVGLNHVLAYFFAHTTRRNSMRIVPPALTYSPIIDASS